MTSRPWTSRLALTTMIIFPHALLSGCLLVGSWETLPCEEDERVQDGACVPCITGAFNEAGDDPRGENTSCAARTCKEDEFVQGNTCQPCPEGQTRQAGDLTLEADTSCEPLVCEANEHVQDHRCVACAPGYWRAAGDLAGGEDTLCEPLLCGVDERVSAHVCVPCDDGTTRRAGDEASGEDTVCEPIRCARNEHVVAHMCQACPSDRPNAAGDDASGQDTACDGAPCPRDTFVVSQMCLPCPSGTTNEAGDDPAGGDTSCDASFCAENEWVQNNQCVPCPAGSANEAGDVTGGPNTSCDPVLCEEHERVQSNTCTPCPPDQTNAAGDDASGADTMCDASDLCIFEFDGVCVTPEPTYVKASNTQGADQFGHVIAMDGDTLVVASPRESSSATGVNANQQDNLAARSGAVYVFVRAVNGQWSQQAYLKASNTEAEDAFGSAVAISGDTIVVGAPGEDSNGNQSNNMVDGCGAAYVFKRDGTGAWAQEAYLKHTNVDVGDRFGESVAIFGDTIVVGAPFEDSASTIINGNQNQDTRTDSGAAYVFARRNSAWTQQAYIKSPNSEELDHFGESVAIFGETIAVSSPGEDSAATGINGNQMDNSAVNSGSVHTFKRVNGDWSHDAYIKASNTGQSDAFGTSIALHQDTLLVGAPRESSDATGVDGAQTSNSASDAGAAYVFVHDVGVWSQQAYLKASNTDRDDRFGESVAIHGDHVLIGAHIEESASRGFLAPDPLDNSSPSAGAAYLFERDPQSAQWSFLAYVKATNAGANDRFGYSVAISAEAIAAGAYLESSNATGIDGVQDDDSASNSGAVYITDFSPVP